MVIKVITYRLNGNLLIVYNGRHTILKTKLDNPDRVRRLIENNTEEVRGYIALLAGLASYKAKNDEYIDVLERALYNPADRALLLILAKYISENYYSSNVSRASNMMKCILRNLARR